MPTFVTQGTIQVERSSELPVVIVITPTPDFSVKHGKDEYIVFLSEEALSDKGLGPFVARLFKKTQAFQAKNDDQVKNSDLISILSDAAFKQTKIEIKIGDVPDVPSDEKAKDKPLPVRIVSAKIPATPTIPSTR